MKNLVGKLYNNDNLKNIEDLVINLNDIKEGKNLVKEYKKYRELIEKCEIKLLEKYEEDHHELPPWNREK